MSLRFAPRWHWILATAAALPLFVALGLWQWHRGEARRAQWEAFAAGDAPAVEVTAAQLARLPRFTRVAVGGQFDAGRQFLLENISHGGAPGYEVLTVLMLAEGSRLLVNRGWLPFSGYREHLPDIGLPAGGIPARLTGRLSQLPAGGLASGRTAPAPDGPWPRVASFPTIQELQEAYGTALLPVVLLLDADSGPGYIRDWRPPGLSPERHFGYAVQWWWFALLALGLFVGLNLKRSHD